MRLLHTADWHVGKRLGRYDRMADHAAVLDEIVDIADDEDVNLVIVAGDLFDRPTPSITALSEVLATLSRLATPSRPVVAIAGNHDSADLFDLLAPLLREQNIYLVGQPCPPEAGGILDLDCGGTPTRIACIPFLRRGEVIDFLEAADTWTASYSDTMGRLLSAFASVLEEEEGVKLLTAHLMAEGTVLGPGRGPRGERTLHLSDLYTAPLDGLIHGPQYVALGHVHAPQRLPGTPIPVEYCGSPLELDFGEAGEDKRVLRVDIEPGGEPVIEPRSLHRGRRLKRARGRFEDLVARPDLEAAYLDLTVLTDGPDPGLAERARQEFAFLVKVRADYPRPRVTLDPTHDVPSWDVLYQEYFRRVHDTEPTNELLDAFRQIYEQSLHAPD